MCGWFRKDHVEPLVFTRDQVASILDRTPVQTFTTPTGRTVTVLRSGEIISAPPLDRDAEQRVLEQIYRPDSDFGHA